MAKKNVRVTIPVYEPDKMIELAENILKKHKKFQGNNSPLSKLEMNKFENLLQTAKNSRIRSKEMRAASESLMEESNIALGIDVGQTISTPNTIYHIMTKIRDQLLVTHRINEEALSEYGFNVVIRNSKLPKKKQKQ